MVKMTSDHLLTRYAARNCLIDWRKHGLIEYEGTSYDELRRLFGDLSRADTTSMEALIGPHGLTIYKMMIARIEA